MTYYKLITIFSVILTITGCGSPNPNNNYVTLISDDKFYKSNIITNSNHPTNQFMKGKNYLTGDRQCIFFKFKSYSQGIACYNINYTLTENRYPINIYNNKNIKNNGITNIANALNNFNTGYNKNIDNNVTINNNVRQNVRFGSKNKGYATKDIYGNIVNSNDCYTTKDVYGVLKKTCK